MRIAIVTSSYPRSPDDSSNGGVFLRDLAAQLTVAGASVTVLTPQRVEPEPDRPWRVASFWWPGAETSLTHLDPRNPRSLARLAVLVASGLAKTVRVCRRERIDYSLCAWAVPAGVLGWTASRVLGVPYAVWAFGSDIWRRGDYPFGPNIVRRVLKDAAAVYADGTGLAREVEAIAGRPCPFLPASRRLPPPSLDALQRGRAASCRFVCVARLHPHKGVDVLLEAIALLTIEERRRMTLEVFGDGPERPRLARRLGELGLEESVQFRGAIGAQELSDRLHTASCLVMPSRVESVPLLLSDAAQARCPVIATDVGDVGSLVRAYQAGDVVEPESPDAIAAALRRFMRHAVPGTPRFDDLRRHLSIERSAARILADAGERRRPAPVVE